jgi:outer membrane immunogenic protein
MKKILFASAAVVALSATPAIAADFDGPYVGANVDYTSTNIDYNEDTGTDTFDFDLSADGFGGNIVAGYRHALDDTFSLGAEVSYGINNADGSFEINSDSVDYEKDNTWSISLRPGLKVSDNVLGYGVLGYSRSEYEISSTATTDTLDEDFNGFVLGAGVEGEVANGFRIRGEYNYVTYGDEDATIGSSDVSVEPTESVFRVGVVKGF